jgi:undecaprenyl-diphosphatase
MKQLLLVLTIVTIFSANSFSDDIFTTYESGILGVAQGIIEYLPISLTGHLILVHKFSVNHKNIQSDTEKSLEELKSQAKNSYFAIIQFGSVLAVLFLYKHRFIDMFCSIFGRHYQGRKSIFNLIAWLLATALIVFLINGLLQKMLDGVIPIAIALIFGSLIMFSAEKTDKNKSAKGYRKIEGLTLGKSLTIGLSQCLSFIPGMSRSMTTIVGGYKCELCRSTAAEYSFLLGFITLGAATAYKFVRDFDDIFLYFNARTFFGNLCSFYIFYHINTSIGCFYFTPWDKIFAS